MFEAHHFTSALTCIWIENNYSNLNFILMYIKPVWQILKIQPLQQFKWQRGVHIKECTD